MSEWALGKASGRDVVRRAHAFVQDVGSRRVEDRALRLARLSTSLGHVERLLAQLVPLEGMRDPTAILGSLMQWILPPFQVFDWMNA